MTLAPAISVNPTPFPLNVPPSIFPVTLSALNVPTLVIFGCAAVVTVPAVVELVALVALVADPALVA